MEVTTTFKSYDGTELYFKKNYVPEPVKARANIILVHGMTNEHDLSYAYSVKRFNAQGYNVFRIDNRGNGRSGGQLNFANSIDEYVEDLHEVVKMVKEESPDLKLFIGGHSLGGGMILHYGIAHPGEADGFIMMAPYSFDLNGLGGREPIPGDPTTVIVNDIDGFSAEACCYDMDYNNAWNTSELIDPNPTIGLANTLNDAAARMADPEYVAKFKDPVIIFQGLLDPLVNEADSRRLYGEISSEDKTLMVCSYTKHSFYTDVHADNFIDITLMWLRRELDGTIASYK